MFSLLLLLSENRCASAAKRILRSKGQSVALVRGAERGEGEVKNEEITNCTLRANARRDGEKRENWRMGERHHQKYTAQNENNNKNKHKQYVYVKFSYSYREFSLSLSLFVVV